MAMVIGAAAVKLSSRSASEVMLPLGGEKTEYYISVAMVPLSGYARWSE